MREKRTPLICTILLLLLGITAVQSKETMKADETVYFPIVVDSRSQSYQILNDSFLREKLEYTKEKEDVDRKSKVQYEIIPLKDVDLKSLNSREESTNIRPHQIKSVSYQDTSLNEKYKVYTGFLPKGSETKYSEKNQRYQETQKYTKQSDEYSPKYSVTESPNPYTDVRKYPEPPRKDSYQESPVERYTENPKPYLESLKRYPESPKKDSYQESPVERYTENPKPYLESLKRYPESPKKDSYQESPVERYTENPKPYLESLKRYPESPKKDSYQESPVERYTENPKPYLESLKRYPESPKKDSYQESPVERYTENPKPYLEPLKRYPPEAPKKDSYPVSPYTENPKSYVEPLRYPEILKEDSFRKLYGPSTTPRPYNPRPVVESYTTKPQTAVGYPVGGNRYTENLKVAIESYSAPKPYGEQHGPSRYPQEKPPKPVVRFSENPRPAIESYTTRPEQYPARYSENPRPVDTYTPRPAIVTYKPSTRYPEIPARYTENPKPVIESYTPKPYTERPASYTTPRPSYPVQRYPEHPRPATKGSYPVTERPKHESYSTTPAYRTKPGNDYRPPATGYEKRPPGYKPLYGSDRPDGYEIYVPEEYDDDYSAIPGKPGIDYPIFDVPPYTYFNCADQDYAGYYADVEARCQVFHICQADGRANAFLCPNGTQFNQQFFVCDWWYNVNCEYAPALYSLNAHLYETPYRRPHY